MSSSLSSDEINRLCQDLVYQVAYAFYDTPYVLLLKLLVNLGVCQEISLAQKLGISPTELRKYFGMLLVHRLVKRFVNKEKYIPEREAVFRRNALEGQIRTRDVIYWYIDYREFANVTKYRLAMMRKQIDDKIKQEVGHRGYICPSCGKTYEPLEIANLFDPVSNIFACDQCAHEVVEHDPTTDPSLGPANQDKMQRFNVATAPIRDALKAVEGTTVPSLNIVAWIAQNVKSLPVLGEDKEEVEESQKYRVVIGDEEDEKERLEKARLAEQQRTQNALPVWHTHSTVTGSATALGIGKSSSASAAEATARRQSKDGLADSERDLADHYANLVEDEDEFENVDAAGDAVQVKMEPGVKIEPGAEEEEEEEADDLQEDDGTGGDVLVDAGPMVMVGGVAKRAQDITEEDEQLMTEEEHSAFYEIMENM